MKYSRDQGHKIITYLDDGIDGYTKYDTALQPSEYIRTSLADFGILLALEICHLTSARVQTSLGYLLI